MSTHLASISGLLLVLLPSRSFADDIHSVFTARSARLGREQTARAETWISAKKEYHLTPAETRIVRRDLGLTWRLHPNAKTYREHPLTADAAPVPKNKEPAREAGRPPAGKDGKEDLRFVGYSDQPVFAWDTRPLGDGVVKGQACKVYFIHGEADFAAVDIKLWLAPDGKHTGLAAPDDLISTVLRREPAAAEALTRFMAAYPKGGIVELEVRSDPPIAPESKVKIALEVYETKEPPAGIYELPVGARRAGGQAP